MQNIGEEITGEYLKCFKHCDFVQYNVYTTDIQGEIDVIGISLKKPKTVYVCEVAIHLKTGLQYTKNNRPDNIKRFINKFEKNIKYTEKYFQGYQKVYMLWSPIVKNPKNDGIIYNQTRHIQEIKNHFLKKYKINIVAMINEDYLKCLEDLRSYAAEETKELKSPVLRLMQIEEKLKKHLKI